LRHLQKPQMNDDAAHPWPGKGFQLVDPAGAPVRAAAEKMPSRASDV
jgi:hypothetical protein